HQAGLNLRTFSILHIVQHRRIFVKRPSDSMATEFPDDAVIVRLRQSLDSGGDVGNKISWYGLLDGSVQTLFRYFDQVGDIGRDFPYPKGPRGSLNGPVVNHGKIEADNIGFAEFPL